MFLDLCIPYSSNLTSTMKIKIVATSVAVLNMYLHVMVYHVELSMNNCRQINRMLLRNTDNLYYGLNVCVPPKIFRMKC